MSLYEYQAISDSGKSVKGQMDAENEKDLESRLNLQGLYLLSAEKKEAIIKRPAGTIQTFCPKCNFLVDTNYDAAGVFGLCTNPACQWILNLKEDAYSVGRPSFIQELRLHQHQHLHQEERETIKSPVPKTPPVSFQPLPFTVGLVGLLLIMGGVFAPFVSVPILGSINLFKDGTGDGIIILALSCIALCFLLLRMYLLLLIFTGLSAAVLVFIVSNYFLLQLGLQPSPLMNPFEQLGARIALQAVHLDWGLGVLFVGHILVFVSVFLRSQTKKS